MEADLFSEQQAILITPNGKSYCWMSAFCWKEMVVIIHSIENVIENHFDVEWNVISWNNGTLRYFENLNQEDIIML